MSEPIRFGLTTSELWSGPDKGLIWCWERGRQKRAEEPALAARAEQGELVPLVWKRGNFLYLATWQGLRGVDLEIEEDHTYVIKCAVSLKETEFSNRPAPSDE